MSRREKIRALKNVSSSWLALGINILVGIFLSPFILHRLGDAAFGIWVLIFSITGYYGLFDLGIRSSIVRYVSKLTATRDREGISKLISTSFFSYTCIAIFTLLLTLIFSAYVDRVFRIPANFHSTAQWLLLMVGASVALGFPLGISGGVLEGLQRFYVLNWTNIVSTLLRAILIVHFLKRGYGLLTIALITIILPVVGSLVRGVIAFRALDAPMGLRYVDWAFFREMANYSGVTFIIIVAGRLRFKTDEIVIGTFLSAVAITYFNIGARIVDYAGELVSSLAQIFIPLSSQSEATGNVDRLRKIFIAGNRFCAFVIFPIAAALIILGKSVIEVWVGRKYVAQSYPVLLVMLIPSTLMLAQSASGRILFGIGKHRVMAMVAFAEGIANLVLSILLVRPYGILGDAFGTAIPLTCTMLFFLPGHLCRQLDVRMRVFLRQAYLLPLALCVPMVLALLLLKRWFVPHNYRQLAFQLAVAGAVYGLGLGWAFLTNQVFHVGDLPRKQPAIEESAATAIESLQQDI